MRYANEALIHCKKRKWKAKTYLLEQSTQDVRVHVVIAFVLLPFIHFFLFILKKKYFGKRHVYTKRKLFRCVKNCLMYYVSQKKNEKYVSIHCIFESARHYEDYCCENFYIIKLNILI